nr:MHYT domain-containing protein [Streptomyces smaragdinus]
MAMLGSALGLRCTMRALTMDQSRRFGWLALGAVAIGTGIFTMHFIAMMGFTARDVQINYDLPLTLASLLVAVVVTGVGVFLVGYRGRTPVALTTGGVITGVGVACMHYMGMAGMRMDGAKQVYSAGVVTLSVIIAVVAATAALWLAMTVKKFGVAIGAALIMGIAVCGMHYTGMEALSVHLTSATGTLTGRTPAEILAPILIGPVLLLVFVGLFVGMDPLEREWRHRGKGGDEEKEEPSEPPLFERSAFEPRS